MARHGELGSRRVDQAAGEVGVAEAGGCEAEALAFSLGEFGELPGGVWGSGRAASSAISRLVIEGASRASPAATIPDQAPRRGSPVRTDFSATRLRIGTDAPES